MKPRKFSIGNKTHEELFDQGLEALREGASREARRFGHALLKRGQSNGYILLGRAAHYEGNLAEAFRWLHRGIEASPDDWKMWHTLGLAESDNGNFPAALEALDRARAMPGAATPYIDCNRAEVLTRMGAFDAALALLDFIEDPQYESLGQAFRISILRRAGRLFEAAELFRATYEAMEDEDIRRAYPDYMLARYQMGEAPEELRREILATSRPLRLLPPILFLLRDMRPPRTGLVPMRLVVLVPGALELDARRRAPAFVAVQVAAEGVEEAVDFVREFEGNPDCAFDSMGPEAKGSPTHAGIYAISGYIGFDEAGEA